MMNVSIAAVALFLILNFAGQTHAYLDPTSGSMMLQMLLGGIAGLLLATRIFWRRLFGVRKQDEKCESPSDGKP